VKLAELPVLVVDCQATGASPKHGHLLEVAWAASVGDAPLVTTSSLVALPRGATVSRRVSRLTGIDREILAGAPTGLQVLERLLAALGEPPVIVSHMGHYERAFLTALDPDAEVWPRTLFLGTHAVGRRALPDLASHSLRALSGYFGTAIGQLRRSEAHVEATAAIWRGLVTELAARHDVHTREDLEAWLAQAPPKRARRRSFPLTARDRRPLPDAPGVYRFLAGDGTVLYVGKATSLKKRISGHYHGSSGTGPSARRERELLSQVHAFEVTPTVTATEAALLESDTIKALDPLYNRALTVRAPELWYASPELDRVAPRPAADLPLGPLRDAAFTWPITALLRGERDPARLLATAWAHTAPPEAVDAGLALLRERHAALRAPTLPGLMRLGAALWAAERAGDDDDDDGPEPGLSWTPERFARSVEKAVLRSAALIRRGTWLTRLVHATVRLPTGEGARLLHLVGGEIVDREDVHADSPLPPPRDAASRLDRHRALDVATYDRLRVLTTELRRLATDGAAVSVRLGPGRPLSARALARRLAWY